MKDPFVPPTSLLTPFYFSLTRTAPGVSLLSARDHFSLPLWLESKIPDSKTRVLFTVGPHAAVPGME